MSSTTTPTTVSYGEAVRRLAGAQKSAQGAPAYSRFVNRPLGRRLAAAAHVLHATPNQVTAASAVASAAGIAAIALAPSRWWAGLLVTGLLVLGYGLDAADGQLARLRGGGSKAGEWLDHVVDSAKTSAVHLAVVVGAYRVWDPRPESWLLVPLAFAVVASTWFFTIILNDSLRRVAGTRDVQATVGAGEARQHSALRSVASVPTDYGVLCLVFLLWGLPVAFGWAYGLLFAGFALMTAASMVKWFRDAGKLDAPAAVLPVPTSLAGGGPMSAPLVLGYVPGVYDMFHVGHLNILRRAREGCDELIVGAVTDEVVERTKKKRPVVPLAERMEILASMAIVDRVVADDCGSDKLPMWERLHFDVLFKGDDWRGTAKGAQLEASMAVVGARVVYFPYTHGTSSTLLRGLITAHG